MAVKTSKKSVNEIIVEQIIEKIQDSNLLPWQVGWLPLLTNYVTGTSYRGINRLLLTDWDNPEEPQEYITIKQLKDFNQKNKTSFWFKSGSKQYYCHFFKVTETKVTGEKEEQLRSEFLIKNTDKLYVNGVLYYLKDDGKIYFVKYISRYYTLYNVKDIFDKEGNSLPPKSVEIDNERHTDAEVVINNYAKREKVEILNDGGECCYYSQKDDNVHIPPLSRFVDSQEYYRAIFHELTHSTGISTRLNRPCYKKYHESKQERSKEELIAEMGSLLLATKCNLKSKKAEDNSAAYIKGWIEYLQNNPNEVVTGMSAADKAVDFILNNKEEL